MKLLKPCLFCVGPTLCLLLSACNSPEAVGVASSDGQTSSVSSSESSQLEASSLSEASIQEETPTLEASEAPEGTSTAQETSTPESLPTAKGRYDFTFDKVVLYDKNDIVITATKNKSADDFEIALVLENNSDKDYDILVNDMAVNGIMVHLNQRMMDTNVPSGKKASTSLSVKDTWFEENDIQDISIINIQFYSIDRANNKSFKTEITSIKTNYFEKKAKEANIPGVKIFNKKGIVVYSLGEMKFLVKNDDNALFHYDVKNFSVNGWAYDIGISANDLKVFPNCVSSFNINVKEELLQENDISEITDAEFNLDIRPLGDFYSEYSTDKMSALFTKK